MTTWAVIPSCTRRDWLHALCVQLHDDGVNTVVVDNGYSPQLENLPPSVTVIRDVERPFNLSRLWNVGLAYVAGAQERVNPREEYVVGVLNDDIQLCAGFMSTLAACILDSDVAGAFPALHSTVNYTLRHAEPVPLHTRMSGFAFAMRGSLNMRADENLKYWFGDDDLDWRLREAGGNLGVYQLTLQHFDPDGGLRDNPELHVQTGLDRQTFISKWGRAPW